MKSQKSLLTFLWIAFATAVIVGSARWWLPQLLTFVGANTSLIQGLADSVQLFMWLGAALAFASGCCIRYLQKSENKSQGRSTLQTNIFNVLGDPPEALSLFEYLKNLLIENVRYVPNYGLREASIREIVQNLKEGVIRIYFFGHQSAGKSSLINALIEKDVSPTFQGKMTTCLIRIKWGSEPLLTERYGNGAENVEERVSKLKKRMEDWENLNLGDRPREVVVEMPLEFLREYNIELIDSPGTGGSWDRRYGTSIEEEIVSSKIKSAAVVVIVYRHDRGDLQAHERLIYDIGNNNISTIGVCNLDAYWAEKVIEEESETHLVIGRTEKKLRDGANAKCYRVAVGGSEAVKELAVKKYETTVEDLRRYIVKLLDNRKSLIIRQAQLDGKTLVNGLLWDIEQQTKRYKPLFDRIESGIGKTLDSINNVRAVLNKGYKPTNNSDAILSSTVIGTAAPPIIATILTGGAMLTGGAAIPFYALLAAGGAAVGAAGSAAIGSISNMLGRKEYRERLASQWTSLQKTIKYSREIDGEKVISDHIIKKASQLSSSLSEAEHESILTDIEKDLDINLQEVEGYYIYRKSKELEHEFQELKGYLR